MIAYVIWELSGSHDLRRVVWVKDDLKAPFNALRVIEAQHPIFELFKDCQDTVIRYPSIFSPKLSLSPLDYCAPAALELAKF